MKEITSVPLNFVVNTVVIQYILRLLRNLMEQTLWNWTPWAGTTSITLEFRINDHIVYILENGKKSHYNMLISIKSSQTKIILKY